MIEDTIAAITTALGPASVGIIRISGPDSVEIADRVFTAKKGVKLAAKSNYTISYGYVMENKKEIVDEAIALIMRSPHSFTGEDVIEFQCHGGMIVLRKILNLLLMEGARLAEPGEFSKRAFLNGKMDLTQAEAIMDMINAKTETSLKTAINNMRGGISGEISKIRRGILEIMAFLEADIDFPEEDIDRLSYEEMDIKISNLHKDVEELIETFRSGKILREGLKTVLIGKPNVGKSSLLNAILREKRAIVTDIPGTTRDIIEEYYNLGGIPLVLVDTAGIRNTEDIIEQLGMERTKEVINKADIILYIFDVDEGITDEDLEFIQQIPKNKILIIANKIDLLNGKQEELAVKEVLKNYTIIFVSAKEMVGFQKLEEGIKKLFFVEGTEISDKTMITNIRHKNALERALVSMNNAIESVQNSLPADFITIDLRSAWLIMGEITGETLGEDLIDQIFSQFCLGK